MENTEPIGLVNNFPTEADAWGEVERLGLRVRINTEAEAGRIKLRALAEHYLRADFGEDAIRPKSANTIPIIEHYVRNWIVERWGDATRCTSDYKPIDITPEQTLAILKSLKSVLHHTLVLTCAGTALRASEILSLRWADVLWSENRIRISKRWAKGADGATKPEASDGYVPLHPILANHLKAWQRATPHAKGTDFVFPSLRENGKIPLCASVFVRRHLRPAAKSAGVSITPGHRFGLHNLRHSLSNWLVSKAKTDPKTVQGLLRHANIKTTLDLYARADGEETRAAQGRYLEAVGLSEAVQ